MVAETDSRKGDHTEALMIGCSSHALAELIELLRAQGITRAVDVRCSPRFRVIDSHGMPAGFRR